MLFPSYPWHKLIDRAVGELSKLVALGPGILQEWPPTASRNDPHHEVPCPSVLSTKSGSEGSSVRSSHVCMLLMHTLVVLAEFGLKISGAAGACVKLRGVVSGFCCIMAPALSIPNGLRSEKLPGKQVVPSCSLVLVVVYNLGCMVWL